MNKLKLLFTTSRPVSWVNTAYPFGLSYILSGTPINATFIISVLFFLIPYNLLMYGVNDVFDYESDIRNPRKGGIEGAITPKKYHNLILATCFILCAPFLFYMFYSGTLISNLCLVIVLFFVVAYSLKGLRFKEVPMLDSITSSIHFAGPLVYAFVVTGITDPNAWMLALAFFFWGMASHAFGAVQDIKPDKKAKISSIATKLGAKYTVRFSVFFYSVAVVLVLIQRGVLVITGLTLLLYVLNIINYWNCTDSQSDSTNKAWKRFITLNYITGAVVTISAAVVYIL